MKPTELLGKTVKRYKVINPIKDVFNTVLAEKEVILQQSFFNRAYIGEPTGFYICENTEEESLERVEYLIEKGYLVRCEELKYEDSEDYKNAVEDLIKTIKAKKEFLELKKKELIDYEKELEMLTSK